MSAGNWALEAVAAEGATGREGGGPCGAKEDPSSIDCILATPAEP